MRMPPASAGSTPGSTSGSPTATGAAGTQSGIASDVSHSETVALVAPAGQVTAPRDWSSSAVWKMLPPAAGLTGSWIVRVETGPLEVLVPPRVSAVSSPCTAMFEAGENDLVGWVASSSGTTRATEAVLRSGLALSATICEVFSTVRGTGV